MTDTLLRTESQSTVHAAPRLSPGWAVFAAVVGPVVAAISTALEPAPANPNAAVLLGTILSTALLVAWGGAAFNAIARRPQALSWAIAVGAVSLAMTIACPTTGHHTIGWWWLGQFAASAGALAAAGYGTIRTRG